MTRPTNTTIMRRNNINRVQLLQNNVVFVVVCMLLLVLLLLPASVHGWITTVTAPATTSTTRTISRRVPLVVLSSSTSESSTTATEDIPYDYTVPEDAVIHIRPLAMQRLRELRIQQLQQQTQKLKSQSTIENNDEYLYLRMGVRSGGCSGMSYVMDFIDTTTTTDQTTINVEDDIIDIYEDDKIKCVIDSKSMLYLYGLQLDYSTALIGGGFKFYNPNAETSCGCGSSFGV